MAGAHDAVAEDHALDQLALLVDADVVEGVDAVVVDDDDDGVLPSPTTNFLRLTTSATSPTSSQRALLSLASVVTSGSST